MKIPAQAKRVFKGIIFDVYQWQQEMFDGSYETFEILKRDYTTQVVATQGERILLSHESQPTKHDFYTFFGGRLEEGEDPLAGAKRELLEEAGLVSDDWELLAVYEPFHKIDWEVYFYAARQCREAAEPSLDAGEKIAVESFSFDEFVDIIISDKFWGREIAFDILRMKLAGKLNEFRERIFSTGKY